jgi:hypothetical protein
MAPSLFTLAPDRMAPMFISEDGARSIGADVCTVGAIISWRRKLGKQVDKCSIRVGAVNVGADCTQFGAASIWCQKGCLWEKMSSTESVQGQVGAKALWRQRCSYRRQRGRRRYGNQASAPCRLAPTCVTSVQGSDGAENCAKTMNLPDSVCQRRAMWRFRTWQQCSIRQNRF